MATPAAPASTEKLYYVHPVTKETFVRANKLVTDPNQLRGGLVAPPLVCCRKPMPEGGHIEVTVEDPYLKNDHYKYRVFLKTNLVEYGYPQMMVKKRYNNFKDLAKRLSYLDSTLPSIPKADFFGRYSKKILNERTQGFQNFLNRVMATPTLNRCPILMDFFMRDWTKSINPDEAVIRTVDLHQQAMNSLPNSPTLSPSSPQLAPPPFGTGNNSASSPNVLSQQPQSMQAERINPQSNTYSHMPPNQNALSPRSKALSPPQKALPSPPSSANRPISPSPLPPSSYNSPQMGSPQMGSPQMGSPQMNSPQMGSPLVGGYSSPQQQQHQQMGSPLVGGYPSPQQGYGSPQMGSPLVGGYPSPQQGYGSPQVGGYPSPQQLQQQNPVGYPRVTPPGLVGSQQPQQPQQQKQPPRGPPRRPAKAKAKGLYDFDAEDETELSFKEGDIITILSKPNDDWWEGLLSTETTSRTGLIPVAYLREL